VGIELQVYFAQTAVGEEGRYELSRLLLPPVLRIRIRRIRMFLGLLDPDPSHMFLGLLDPDPDPLVRGMDPDPSVIKQK
jgi:hypothetical protein